MTTTSIASLQSYPFDGMKGTHNRFISIHDEFTDHGWDLIANEHHLLKYSKNEGMDEFTIQQVQTSSPYSTHSLPTYEVTVPLAGTTVAYRTKFTDYFAACDHIYNHLNIYEAHHKDIDML
jgi:hypothetical protein